jgi:hypothetical protein
MIDQQNLVIKHYKSAKIFLNETKTFLEEQELINSIIIFAMQEENKKEQEPSTYCSALVDTTTNKFVFALFAVKDYFLYASGINPSVPQEQYQSVVELLVQDFASASFPITAIQSYEPVCSLFKPAVEKVCHVTCGYIDDLWSYDIKQVTWNPRTLAIRDAPGTYLKQASLDDLPLLTPWMEGFFIEAGGNAFKFLKPKGVEHLRESLAPGYVYILYVGGEPVSMAWKRRPLHYGTSIACVYTPKELRGKGYAAVCVGMCTDLFLKEYRYVTLFVVSEQNPDRNMYTGVGYRLYSESLRYSVTCNK